MAFRPNFKRLLTIGLGATALAYLLTPDETRHHLAMKFERKRCGFDAKVINVHGFATPYLEGGNPAYPTLVLVHGFAADKDNWLRMAAHLVHRFHVIALDLQGFGDNNKPLQHDYSTASQAAFVHQFLAQLNLRGPVQIAGHSMGGYIAAEFAANYPEQTQRLWLICPLGVEGAQPSELTGLLEQNLNPLTTYDMTEYKQLTQFVFEHKPWIPGPVLRTLAARAAQDVYLHQDIFEQIQPTVSLEDVLAKVKAPIFVTWGKADRVLHVSGAACLAEANPNVTVDLINSVGHVPIMERPRHCAATFMDWQTPKLEA